MPRKELSQKGNYYELSPIDLAILETLPPQGQMLGWHPIADTARTLGEKLNRDIPKEGWATHEQITGRLVSLHKTNYVTRIKLLAGADVGGSGMGWQRTPKGEEFYAKTTGRTLPGSSQNAGPNTGSDTEGDN